MKIVSKEIHTTIVDEYDGCCRKVVYKAVTVNNLHESLEVGAVHAIIVSALQGVVRSQQVS